METMDAPGSNAGDAVTDIESSGGPRAILPVASADRHHHRQQPSPGLPAARRNHGLGGADEVDSDVIARAIAPASNSNDGGSGIESSKRQRKPPERLVSSRIPAHTRMDCSGGTSMPPTQPSVRNATTRPLLVAGAGVESGTAAQTEVLTEGILAGSRGDDGGQRDFRGAVDDGNANDADAPTIIVETPGPYDVVLGEGDGKYPGNLYLGEVMRLLQTSYIAIQQRWTGKNFHPDPLILSTVSLVMDDDGGHVLEKKGDNFASAKNDRKKLYVYDYISSRMGDNKDLESWNPCPPKDDCPVCMVSLPLNSALVYWDCCGQIVCRACDLESRRARQMANAKREEKELPPLEEVCPFCRTVAWKDDESSYASRKLRLEQRAENDDMEAAYMLGMNYLYGEYDFKIDQERALKFIHRAADVGSTAAMSILGRMYAWGDYGMVVDRLKGQVYFEKAARQGNVDAHYCLGLVEEENGDIDLSIKHHAIAAEAGDSYSMKELWRYFYEGKLSKLKLEEVLRQHQEAFGEMDTEERKRHRGCLRAENEAFKGLYRNYYWGKISGKHLERLLNLDSQ